MKDIERRGSVSTPGSARAGLAPPRGTRGGCALFSNIGWSGVLLIVVAALFVFGPKKLPELGRSVGHFLREFRTALGDREAEASAPAKATASEEPTRDSSGAASEGTVPTPEATAERATRP